MVKSMEIVRVGLIFGLLLKDHSFKNTYQYVAKAEGESDFHFLKENILQQSENSKSNSLLGNQQETYFHEVKGICKEFFRR